MLANPRTPRAKKNTCITRFELARSNSIGLAVQRLNHSAICTENFSSKFYEKLDIVRTFNSPSSSPVWTLRVLVPVIHTNQSASNWQHTSERVRARVNKLTHEHSSCRSSTTSHYSQKSTSPRNTENQVSAPLPRNFNTFEQSNCLCRYKRARKADRRNRSRCRLTHPPFWPLCPASGDFA